MVPRFLFALALLVSSCSLGMAATPPFDEDLLRGDANNDSSVNFSDSLFINSYLFYGGSTPPCMDAADVNDDGGVDSSDVVYLNNFLFQGGSQPPSPYPSCGQDTTSDSVHCNQSACP